MKIDKDILDAMKKPPLGLKPRYIHDGERLYEIKEAIVRYMDADCPIPAEWVREYNELISRKQI